MFDLNWYFIYDIYKVIHEQNVLDKMRHIIKVIQCFTCNFIKILFVIIKKHVLQRIPYDPNNLRSYVKRISITVMAFRL